jgi:hypothetical protein
MTMEKRMQLSIRTRVRVTRHFVPKAGVSSNMRMNGKFRIDCSPRVVTIFLFGTDSEGGVTQHAN